MMLASEIERLRHFVLSLEADIRELRELADTETPIHTQAGHIRFARASVHVVTARDHIQAACRVLNSAVGVSELPNGNVCTCGAEASEPGEPGAGSSDGERAG